MANSALEGKKKRRKECGEKAFSRKNVMQSRQQDIQIGKGEKESRKSQLLRSSVAPVGKEEEEKEGTE